MPQSVTSPRTLRAVADFLTIATKACFDLGDALESDRLNVDLQKQLDEHQQGKAAGFLPTGETHKLAESLIPPIGDGPLLLAFIAACREISGGELQGTFRPLLDVVRDTLRELLESGRRQYERRDRSPDAESLGRHCAAREALRLEYDIQCRKEIGISVEGPANTATESLSLEAVKSAIREAIAEPPKPNPPCLRISATITPPEITLDGKKSLEATDEVARFIYELCNDPTEWHPSTALAERHPPFEFRPRDIKKSLPQAILPFVVLREERAKLDKTAWFD